jgi:ParB/RepB/Spo0J family partition protein
MQLDLHLLEPKYAHLRRVDATRRRRLLASLSELGQQQPVLVVASRTAPGRYVLIDGYLRVEVLRELGRDVVEAVELEQSEAEALIFAHRLEHGAGRSALEEAWLIRELVEGHGLEQSEVAVRLCRSRSWVCRRLALVRCLPEVVQQAVLAGQVPPHAAVRYLAQLARANSAQCVRLVENLGKERLSVRQIGRLYAGWRAAGRAEREKIVEAPLRFLEVEAVILEPDPGQERDRSLIEQLAAISALCRRVRKLLAERERTEKSMPWPTVLRLAWQETQAGFAGLVEAITEVSGHA